jgi:glycosyltransferase involved in cell wall biosynthesis
MNGSAAASASAKSKVINDYPTLTVVVPVHNEECILEQQTLDLIQHVRTITEKFEVLLVENGSNDRTLLVLDNLQRRFNFIRSISLEKADYSTAVIEGIKSARGTYSVVTGIDYVDLSVLDRCFAALKSSDIVICSKNKGSDQRSFMNRFVNRSYNVLARLFFRLQYSDVEGYQGYNTYEIQKIVSDVKTKAHLCNIWILLRARKAGLRVTEVPFVVYEKRKSKFMRITRLPYLASISLLEFIRLKCKGL